MSLGKGSPISISRKQKLNTKSSTEAELVGVDDAMALVLWSFSDFVELHWNTHKGNYFAGPVDSSKANK